MKAETGSLTISRDDLDLDHTLAPGQSFRWRRDDLGRWTGVVGRRIVRIERDGSEIRWEVVPGGVEPGFIESYLRLDVNLDRLYRDFAKADGRIVEAIREYRGLRVLRQPPEETLLSYICSTANSVPRISGAIEAMSRLYGDFIGEMDGREYYAFPSAEALARGDADDLRSLCGLGFRGANLRSVAAQLLERPVGWLDSLRDADYRTARAEVFQIWGVGCKIADCVLLFSLDKDQAFPVDTHVRRMAVKHYLPEFREKTLTHAVYEAIVDHFQRKFGPYAGWAQEYLFYYDLLRRKPPKEEPICSP